VRFPIEHTHTNIVLPVTLLHKGNILDCHLIFDTGASMSVISWEIADFIGVIEDKSIEKIRIMTGSGYEYCPIYRLDSLTVGNCTVKNLNILCHDLPDRSRVEGLLGLDFVKVHDVIVSYKQGYLEIR
jgi:predicted aspartyl protease